MGTIQIDGSTPKLTIGNATAEDATILFDGNAQDFYIALDDSADDLLIGLGSTVGTTPAISIDENLAVKTYGDITMTGTTPVLTIGDAGAEDTAIVFDGNAQDFYIALDDSADDLVIGLGSTVGTTPAISINSDRDVTISDGAIDFDVASHDTSNGLKLGGTLVTATAAELNIMDGVTSTAAEINLIDGGTARGTTALADGDGILINDAGTMRMTNVTTVKTYMGGAAADDITAGDSAVSISTTSGDITIENDASDADIIFKGNDGGSDMTALTLDMSADGHATFKNGITLSDGDVVVASGHGMDFSATSDTGETSGSLSEVFDDYEEGYYTAAITTGSGSITLQSNIRNLAYMKIGRLCHISGQLYVDSSSSPDGTMTFNIPFALGYIGSNRAPRVGSPMLVQGAAGNSDQYFLVAWEQGTSMNVYKVNGTTIDASIADDFPDNGDLLQFNISYMTA